ncbi:hypothetical protein Bbelb_307700 [Branchiostoma belcheri]|nr:hypothetical protein Bbelb_307700 [Branchiostoma belcheri]
MALIGPARSTHEEQRSPRRRTGQSVDATVGVEVLPYLEFETAKGYWDLRFITGLYVYFAGEKDRRAQDNGRSMIQSPCTWRHRLASRSSCGFPRCVAKGSGTYTGLPADPTHRAAFHEIGAGWLGNDPIGMTERRASSKRYKNVTSTTQGQTDFYTSALCAFPQPTDSLGNSNYSHDRQVNLRHAARDTLLFYTEHRCWHIRLCHVRAKLPAPANNSGFRTVETISVHGEGFTLHDDKHNSYSRIQSKSGTKYQADFGMSTLRCRLQQEFTG